MVSVRLSNNLNANARCDGSGELAHCPKNSNSSGHPLVGTVHLATRAITSNTAFRIALLGARIASSRSMPFAAVRSLADRFAENALGPHRRFTVTYASVRTLSSAVADEPISNNDFNAFLPLSARSSARSPLERVSASLESAAASDDKTPFTVSSPGSRAP